jgi:hypothetical protein
MSFVRDFFEGVKAALPGLDDLVPEMTAELSRLGTQGSMEMAGCLFNGNAFAQYGPGQYAPSPDQESILQGPQSDQPQQDLERGGRDM